MERKAIFLAFGPSLACVGVSIVVTQGQNTWVPNNHWLAQLLWSVSILWAVLVWQWPRLASAKTRLRARIRGEYRYIQPPFRMKGSRLEIGSLRSGSIRVNDKIFNTTTVSIRNAETRLPNRCNDVRAEILYRHLYDGMEFKKEGWFVDLDGWELISDANRSITLGDGEKKALVVFVSGPHDTREPSLYVFTQHRFDPNFQTILPRGEWMVSIRVRSDDKDCAEISLHVKIERYGGSSWGFRPFQR